MTDSFIVTPDAFVNDTCFYRTGYDSVVRFYSIDESYKTVSGLVEVKRVMCEYLVTDSEGNTTGYTLPNIIGMSNSIFGIRSDIPSLQGAMLTLDNISDCIMEYYNA